ncbi:MAG: hypothetical protein NUV56_00435 [Candidatus Uhrbacteria bacterium]|nr:hypothetical protein [Candidatus Uhrbacteria bacterium]
MDTRALSLAFGTASAVVSLLALILFGTTVGLSGMVGQAVDGATAFWVGVLTIVGAFIQGAIMGAIIGAIYNRYQQAEWSESEDVETDRGVGAAA